MTAKGFTDPEGISAPSAKSRSRNDSAAFAAIRAGEARLLERAGAGDRRALEQLLERASAPAWRWSRGFCRNEDDAADLVQDVLHALLRSLSRFRGDASLSTWTYVVARRACARRRSQAARMGSLDAPAAARLREHPDPAPGPARRVEHRQLAERLERAIAALPMPQREVLVMRDVEGLSAAEVGEALGLGERAVKSRLHRARLAVRTALAPYVAGRGAPEPGSGCPDTARMLSRYLEGELDAGTCARMEEHVRGCEACGGTCASLRSVLGACHAYGRRTVPRALQRAVREAVQRTLDG
jgi:RNA polymerase sigma-70 factor (ECF subfamily)